MNAIELTTTTDETPPHIRPDLELRNVVDPEQIGSQLRHYAPAAGVRASTADGPRGMTRPVALLRKERIARDTCAFAFERPPGFTFTAGQALGLTLIDPARHEDLGARRTFSIVSAPYERDLVVATRIRNSTFKRGLDALEVGAYALIDGPRDSLQLHENLSRPAVFIAGGIGITPFMSILRQAAHDRREQVLTLLYSNRQPDDAAFFPELLEYERQHRGTFNMRATITGTPPPKPVMSVGRPAISATPPNAVDWHRDRVRIGAALVNSVIVQPSMPMFYVAGPPSMVSGIRQVLHSLGIRDDDIQAEGFLGY